LPRGSGWRVPCLLPMAEGTSLRRMKTTVSPKGQIDLPAAIRRQDRIEAGQEFEIERLYRGEYRLKRCMPRLNAGVVDWLLACPEKGYFVPIEFGSFQA